MKRLSLDMHQVQVVPYSYDLAPLYQGEVDSTAVYATGGIIRLRQAGYQPNLIWPSDYGIHLYSDTLITANQTIAERPGLVVRFLQDIYGGEG